MRQETVYLCKPASDEVVFSGDMLALLENAEILRLSGEICSSAVDESGKQGPGLMFGIMDNGKPYIFPLFHCSVGIA
ncbi:MAG: hypothetical protein EB127_31000 [Alphaproteobacteria bacterium]|nr:hypothetical protein [Alphaproteobacteria bacterium]